jgi:hypothetical protein
MWCDEAEGWCVPGAPCAAVGRANLAQRPRMCRGCVFPRRGRPARGDRGEAGEGPALIIARSPPRSIGLRVERDGRADGGRRGTAGNRRAQARWQNAPVEGGARGRRICALATRRAVGRGIAVGARPRHPCCSRGCRTRSAGRRQRTERKRCGAIRGRHFGVVSYMTVAVVLASHRPPSAVSGSSGPSGRWRP